MILALAGAVLAAILAPMEAEDVRQHLAGFPDAHAHAHQLRPVILGMICFIPMLAAIYYGLVGSLDRYLIRHFIGAFAICFGALYSIWLISDLTDNISDFRESDESLTLMGKYYLAAFPQVFVQFAPFGLLLAMLWSLGKLSQGQEIVSIIQTGRGVARLILPMVVMGGMVGLICLGFNYQWAPWGISFQKAILEKASEGSLSKARNVVYPEDDENRHWYIGGFPYDYHQGEPLQNVIIRSFTPEGKPKLRLEAETAQWNRENGDWVFRHVLMHDVSARLGPDGPLSPKRIPTDGPMTFKGWPETPWKLIKPALKAEHLGVPGLYSWLLENEDMEWTSKKQFLTQWHYRWAQPGICLAIVLLAAPLGIVFSRRGTAGGIALAVFLCAGMMFSSTVFLALGESGYLRPAWAAWGTNIITTVVALILIQRRLVGRPIYQTLRKLLPL